MNNNEKQKLDFNEPVSAELKNKIFKNVSPLMQSYAEKHQSPTVSEPRFFTQLKAFFKIQPLAYSGLALCFVCLVGLQMFKTQNSEELLPASFSEITALSSEDLLVVQNLDLLELIDELSPSELEELEREVL